MSFFNDLATALADYLRKHPPVRTKTGWICLVLLVLALGGFTAVSINPFIMGRVIFDKNSAGPFLAILAFLAFAGLGIVGVSFLDPDRLSEANHEKAILKTLGALGYPGLAGSIWR